MEKVQLEIWESLEELDSEMILRLITGYHGLKLLDEGFKEYLKRNEVIIDVEEVEELYD